MSGKLDQPLDEIIKTHNKTNRRGGPRGAKTGKPVATPVGGIKKSRASKPATKLAPNVSAPASRDSKIVVSGLPTDVNEAQIKEYFQKSVGSVKRVMITYNQHGVSRGIAQIYFMKSDSAAKAAKDLNGMLVDKRPMKIELVLDASAAPERGPKSLSERVAYAPGQKKAGKQGPLTKSSANPKAQPKSAATDKAKDAAGKKGRPVNRGRGRARRGTARPKKTADELDQEMTDYMTGTAATTETNTTAAAPAAGNGEDLGMDEIS